MATQALPPFSLDDFSSGMLDNISVSDALMPKNAVRHAINVRFDRPRGSITQRLGTTKLGSTIGGTINGLHNFRAATSSATNQLLASSGGTVYYLNGATWTSTLTSLDPTAKVRFFTYLDRVAAMNGVDAVKSWNGVLGSWTASGGPLDEANFPLAKYATTMNGRIVAAGVASFPSRIYESSIVSGSSVSWTSGNRTVDVFTNDGSGVITSLAGNGRMVLVFKERALFRYDGDQLQRVVNIGTTSNESVVTDDSGTTYFFGQGANSIGFYATNGGYPKKLSRPVQKWIEAISASFYAEISGYTDGQKVYWSVGSVTINGVVYTNAWLVYSIADQTWEARDYADRYRVFSQYIDTNSNITTVGGDTDGMVQTIDSGNTDNSDPIYSECELTPIVMTRRGETKIVKDTVTLATNFQGLKLHMDIDGHGYREIGSINAREKLFKSIPDLKGHTFTPKITAVNNGTPFQFDGLEFSATYTEGYSL